MLEQQFWEVEFKFAANFEDKDKASYYLQRLEVIANEFDVDTYRHLVFVRKVQIVKKFGSMTELENLFNQSFKHFSSERYDYFYYLADYILLLNALNKPQEAQKLISNYRGRTADKNEPALDLALNLFLEPTEENYQALKKVCLSSCHFVLYHRAIMNYYKVIEDYTTLELYAREQLDRLIGKSVSLPTFYLVNFIMGYLNCALKNLLKPELAAIFYDLSVEGADEQSFLYHQIVEIRK